MQAYLWIILINEKIQRTQRYIYFNRYKFQQSLRQGFQLKLHRKHTLETDPAFIIGHMPTYCYNEVKELFMVVIYLLSESFSFYNRLQITVDDKFSALIN